MKISASIYSNKEKSLEDLVRELDAHGIDMLHVDCADNDKVFDDIAAIRKFSSTPIDLHIISSTPEKYLQKIEELKIEYVSFQYENLTALPMLPKNTSTKFGLSVVSSTGIDVFEKAKGDYSFVVMMATTPGKSGGAFSREIFQKIIAFKNRFPQTQIHVDGGVNDEIGFILRLLGVHSIVSGSYLMNHESMGAGLLSFHKTKTESKSFTISDFATPVPFLPILNSNADFKTILKTIDDFKFGFVLLVSETGTLEGVVSNADIRRGLLKNSADFNLVNTESIVNKNSISIQSAATLSEMIKLVNELNFIVLFLPVVDEKNILKGAVLLNNLTRV